MDISKLPLHQKTTIIAKKWILATASKINDHEAIISYINLKNHQEVLRFLQNEGKDIQIIQYVDDDYWDIYADGKRVTMFDFEVIRNIEVKMEINTADKILEIRALSKGFFNKLKKPIESFFKNSANHHYGFLKPD